MLNPGPSGIAEEARAFKKWQHLADLEERFLRQKSKLPWLKVGDGNNRYYHQAAKHRETQNSIQEVVRGDGSIADTHEDIKTEAETFFKNLFVYK